MTLRRSLFAYTGGRGDIADNVAAEPAAETEPSIPTALRHLTPAQRAAAYLHYQADWPVAEVASVLGMSKAAVRLRLFRAMFRHHRLLGEDGSE